MSAAPTPPAQTPVNFLKAGGVGMFSAACIKLLLDAQFNPEAFGKWEDVDKQVKKAKQKVSTYKKMSPEERLARPGARPTKDEVALASGTPKLLGYRPESCEQKNNAGVLQGSESAPGGETGAESRSAALGAPAGSTVAQAATDREAVACKPGDAATPPPASERASVQEQAAGARPDEAFGTQKRAGGLDSGQAPRDKAPLPAEADGKTAAACLESFRKMKLDDDKRTFKPAKEPKERGMRPQDDKAFSELAQKNKEIILVRDSNPIAAEFMPGGKLANVKESRPALAAAGCTGFAPKPELVKCKTLKEGPNEGLAALRQQDCKSPEEYQKSRKKLEKNGFTVVDEQDGVVLDSEGRALHSDYDLHGTYDQNGKSTWEDDRAQTMSGKLAPDVKPGLIQHGPHDVWDDRLSPSQGGVNAGPQVGVFKEGQAPKSVTAYTPDGKAVALDNPSDMKAFYAQNCIPWPYTSDYSID